MSEGDRPVTITVPTEHAIPTGIDLGRSTREQLDLEAKTARFPIRRYASLDAMKADEYEYWQTRPAHERMQAVTDISEEAYGLKGSRPHASRLQRTLIHLKR